jgi:hypothetical protein
VAVPEVAGIHVNTTSGERLLVGSHPTVIALAPLVVPVAVPPSGGIAAARSQAPQPGTGVYTQPATALHVSVVHALLSLQVSAAPAWHVPDWQVSAPLHALLSPHAVPFDFAGCVHAPPPQTSFVHGLPSSAHWAVLFV